LITSIRLMRLEFRERNLRPTSYISFISAFQFDGGSGWWTCVETPVLAGTIADEGGCEVFDCDCVLANMLPPLDILFAVL
jgi:hypothetical protein